MTGSVGTDDVGVGGGEVVGDPGLDRVGASLAEGPAFVVPPVHPATASTTTTAIVHHCAPGRFVMPGNLPKPGTARVADLETCGQPARTASVDARPPPGSPLPPSM